MAQASKREAKFERARARALADAPRRVPLALQNGEGEVGNQIVPFHGNAQRGEHDEMQGALVPLGQYDAVIHEVRNSFFSEQPFALCDAPDPVQEAIGLVKKSNSEIVPLHPARIEHMMKRKGVVKSEAAFSKEASKIVALKDIPPTWEKRIPKKVKYETMCGDLCDRCTRPAILELRKILQAYARDCQGAGEKEKSQMLLSWIWLWRSKDSGTVRT